jgi:hypothetical protein
LSNSRYRSYPVLGQAPSPSAFLSRGTLPSSPAAHKRENEGGEAGKLRGQGGGMKWCGIEPGIEKGIEKGIEEGFELGNYLMPAPWR